MTLIRRDWSRPGGSEDILVLHRWEHGGVPVARIRTGSGVDYGAVSGEAAITDIVASWLRGDRRQETSESSD